MAPPKFFKTYIIIGRNRSHTFSFKSWPPYEKNLAPRPIRIHKNGPPQISTFHLFDFSFHSLRHVSHISHFIFLSEAMSHIYSKSYVILVWELSLESRERIQYRTISRNEIDFEFIFYHSSLIWLNLIAIYFIVAYSD